MSVVPATHKPPLLLGILCAIWLTASAQPSTSSEHPSHPSSGHWGFLHQVKKGDTYASLAVQYYGDAEYERVLEHENRFPEPKHGMHLLIPSIRFHVVQSGETWDLLSKKFYQEETWKWLFEKANPTQLPQPDVGAEIIVPYLLTHVVTSEKHLKDVAQFYQPKGNGFEQELRKLNRLRSSRLSEGDTLLIPFYALSLTSAAQESTQDPSSQSHGGGETLKQQRQIPPLLESLHELSILGEYEKVLSLGGQLLSMQPSGNQQVSIHREMANAYVAFGREDLAMQAFITALTAQPDLELDSQKTSPKVLTVFDRAKGR